MILNYSDNLDKDDQVKLIAALKALGQSLAYFNSCAKRMGRYARKDKRLKDWPRHIRDKYHFVVNTHTNLPAGSVLTT